MDTNYNIDGAFKPTVKRFADLDGSDFYLTPAWATHAPIDNEQFEGGIWELSGGDGSMAEVLMLTGNTVVSSDLVDGGFCEGGDDSLTSSRRATMIITYGAVLARRASPWDQYRGHPPTDPVGVSLVCQLADRQPPRATGQVSGGDLGAFHLDEWLIS